MHYIIFILFIIYFIFFIDIIHYILCINYNNNRILLIAIISCNRYTYLNYTLYSFTNHLETYEDKSFYNIIFLDQGTKERYYIVKKYNLLNSFFLNPQTYSLSFNIIFSFLYTKYLLTLEEDWKVIDNIENDIFHPSFIKESIFILKYYKNVYGILLRDIKDISVNYSVSINTNMGKHLLHVLCIMKTRYSFTNGACIYRCSDLLKLKNYRSEIDASNFFKTNNYALGFTYKGRKGKSTSTHEQCVMIHIGKRSTKSGLCNISLY